MIQFKAIRWQNLLSTGNQFTEVPLDSTRTSLIIGINGSGKSTILDAITFVLFNKPFRRVNKGQLINSITGKNLLVEIEFDKGDNHWLVRRGSKPNLFEIYRNEVLVDQNADAKDYQAYLENVLGMNQKAFSQVVILGAASFVPFMQLTVPARREVIEDLLDIQVFTDMNILLKARASINKQTMVDSEHGLSNAQTKLDMVQEFNNKQLADKQGEINIKQQKIEELTQIALDTIEKLEAEQTKLDDLQIDTSQVEVLNKCKRKLEDEILMCQQEIRNSERITAFFNQHDSCPTCKQNIAPDFKVEELAQHESTITMMNDIRSAGKEKISEIDMRLDEMFETGKLIKKSEALIIEYNREVGWYQQQVEALASEITALEAANQKSLTDIEPFQKELDDKLSALEVCNQHTKVLDAAATLLKDGGIKSVIIRQYIPVINNLINKYLASMDFFVDFQINEAFEETIKSRFRDDFSYESFSEGEKQRIDLAVLFTWRAVAKMRNSAACNILIFDEILDSSLDHDGQGAFTKILETMVDHENIFIISHNVTIGDSFDRVLKFSKVRGYSQLVEV